MVLLLTSNVGNDAMHRVIGGVYELYILLVVVGGVQELNMVFLSHLHGSNGKKELITLKIGSDRSPVIMTINEMLLDNTTMYQARLLIDGAVRRQYSPSSSQSEVSLGTPGTAV